MRQFTTIFSQIQKLVPRAFLKTLIDRYRVNKHATVFKNDAHFLVLLFAQLAGLDSTRDIERATNAPYSPKGLISSKKSTLSDANNRIDWHFYYELFQALLAHFKPLFGHHKFTLPGNLFSLDSTLVFVCTTSFTWASYRTNQGGLKLHTLLNHAGHIPQDIVMTNGRVSDITVAREMEIEPGATYLVDRAYLDSKWLHDIHIQGSYFVTRMKKNVKFEYFERQEVQKGTGVHGDWIGHFTGKPKQNYPEPVRVVWFKDPKTKKKLKFLTNHMDLPAEEIAELYKQRWQVELFFKWVKQNLKIKKFMGTSINAVLSQVWVAMIAYLLLKVIEISAERQITTHQLLVFVKTHILMKIAVSQAWQAFEVGERKGKRKIE